MRSHCVPEHCLVVSLFQTIRTTILLVGPSHRQIASGGQFVIDDGSVADGGSQNLVTTIDQGIRKFLEIPALQDVLNFATLVHSHLGYEESYGMPASGHDVH